MPGIQAPHITSRTSAGCRRDGQVPDCIINGARLPHAAAVPSPPSALRTNSSGSGGDAAASPSAAALGAAQAGAAGCPAEAGVQLDPVVAKALRKQRLLQDKNRRAQARFRERQKVGCGVHSQTKCMHQRVSINSCVDLPC